jgi:hypothetical protein
MKNVIQKTKNSKKIKMINPPSRVMNTDVDFLDETKLANITASCITDNEQYLVKNQRIKELVFHLVKVKIKTESLVLTPNL